MTEVPTIPLPTNNVATTSAVDHEYEQRNSTSFAHNLALFHEHYDEAAQIAREIEAERQKTLLMLGGYDVDDKPYVTHITDFGFDQFCKELRLSEPGTKPEKPTLVKLPPIKKATTAPDLTLEVVSEVPSPGGSFKERKERGSPTRTPRLARLRGPIHQTPTLQKLGGAYMS